MKPMSLEPRRLHVRADRRLVFQMLTAYARSGLVAGGIRSCLGCGFGLTVEDGSGDFSGFV